VPRRGVTARRRLLIALGAGALAAPFAPFAQQRQRIYRIGILYPDTVASGSHLIDGFIEELRRLGYIEGKNAVIERNFAEGNLKRLPVLVADLVARNVDVIVAEATGPAQEAKRSSGKIPVIFVNAVDPVGNGLVSNLVQPGGNITGISSVSRELSAKRLQLLKEALPKLARVAVLASSDSTSDAQLAEVRRAAKPLGVEVSSTLVTRREDFAPAMALLRQLRADSLLCVETSENFHNRRLLADFAAEIRLPAIFGNKEYVDVGGLMSYGASYEDNYRRAAGYVDKILKGAKPGELPVEQPARFELAVSVKAAGALGLTLPQALLRRADKVIE